MFEVNVIRQIRSKAGWNQTELANNAGYVLRTIQRRESATLPNPEFVAELIQTTKMDPTWVASLYGAQAEAAIHRLVGQKERPPLAAGVR